LAVSRIPAPADQAAGKGREAAASADNARRPGATGAATGAAPAQAARRAAHIDRTAAVGSVST